MLGLRGAAAADAPAAATAVARNWRRVIAHASSFGTTSGYSGAKAGVAWQGRRLWRAVPQKLSFKATWSVRGLFCVAVMTPKLVDPTVTFGSAKMGLLVTLKASPRS